jgi:hypothetical protein
VYRCSVVAYGGSLSKLNTPKRPSVVVLFWGVAPPRPHAILGASGVEFVVFDFLLRQVSNSYFSCSFCASGVDVLLFLVLNFWTH